MGCFDSVIANCPHCKQQVELQTKVGPCQMNRYCVTNVPTFIATGLDGDTEDYNSTCTHCGKRYILRAEVPQRVMCKLVPYSPEDAEEDWD